MNYFPFTTLFPPTEETPQAPRCYITISMLRVLMSSIPLFQQPWPFQLGLTMPRTWGWILLIPFVFPLSFNGTASSQRILLSKSDTRQVAFSITTTLTSSSIGGNRYLFYITWRTAHCFFFFFKPPPKPHINLLPWVVLGPCNKWTLKEIDHSRIKYDQETCKIILNLVFTFRFTEVDIKFEISIIHFNIIH